MGSKMHKIFANQQLYTLRTAVRESTLVNQFRLQRDRHKNFDSVLLSKGTSPEKLMKKFSHLIPVEGVQRNEMIRVSRKYQFTFNEYFLFRLWEKSEEEISDFISNYQQNYYHVRLNNAFTASVFNDKYQTFSVFEPYYKRNAIRVKEGINEHFKDIVQFAEQQKDRRAIVKPIYGGCGGGVKLLDLNKTDIKELFKDFTEAYKKYRFPYICEEVIQQDSRIGELHPESVNTVRITTIRTDKEVKIIHPFFRLGRGDSIVDNGGAGGIICGIDIETGKLDTSIDELGYRYDVHPETGKQIIGFQIPKWDKVVALSKELSMVVPGNRYTGWDFALTNQGWVMVEGNMDGQFIGWQMLYQKGFRPELDEIMKEVFGRTISL